VLEELGGQIEAVIAAGPTPVGIESTVISLVEEPPRVLRPGGTPLELLREVLGDLRADPPQVRYGPTPSPGTLKRHYMPRTPLYLLEMGLPEEGWEELPRERCGYLGFTSAKRGFRAGEVLSERGDLREAAARFFASLRRLDAMGFVAIVAEPVPEEGLGVAIMDRLKRAAQGVARLNEHSVWIKRR
jgi:L-threonylcarbamoyladenylate synthase